MPAMNTRLTIAARVVHVGEFDSRDPQSVAEVDDPPRVRFVHRPSTGGMQSVVGQAGMMVRMAADLEGRSIQRHAAHLLRDHYRISIQRVAWLQAVYLSN